MRNAHGLRTAQTLVLVEIETEVLKLYVVQQGPQEFLLGLAENFTFLLATLAPLQGFGATGSVVLAYPVVEEKRTPPSKN